MKGRLFHLRNSANKGLILLKGLNENVKTDHIAIETNAMNQL